VRYFDLESGKMLKQAKVSANKKAGFQADRGFITADGGTLIACGLGDKADVRVIDLAEGKEIRRFKAAKAPQRLGLDPDGKRLVGLIGPSQIAEWDVTTGKEVRKAPAKAPGASPWDVLFTCGEDTLLVSPGGRYVADILQN